MTFRSHLTIVQPPPARLPWHDQGLTTSTVIPARTGPLPRGLRGRILLLADVENLVLSARDRGLALDFAALRAVFGQVPGCTIDLHAIYSEMPEDAPVAAWLKERGWTATPRPPIEQGRGRGHRNADTWVAFFAGSLLSQKRYDGLILGTGDGLLGLDIARSARAVCPGLGIVATLSVSGCTSRLLVADSAGGDISVNMLIGRDVTRALA